MNNGLPMSNVWNPLRKGTSQWLHGLHDGPVLRRNSLPQLRLRVSCRTCGSQSS